MLGRTPIEAGLLFFPSALASVAASTFAGPLATRLGVRTTAALGLLVLGIGLLLMASLGRPVMLSFVLIGAIVAEIGFMLGHVPLTIVAAALAGAFRDVLLVLVPTVALALLLVLVGLRNTMARRCQTRLVRAR